MVSSFVLHMLSSSSIHIYHPLPSHFQTHRMFLMWIFQTSLPGQSNHYNLQNLHLSRKELSRMLYQNVVNVCCDCDCAALGFDSSNDNIYMYCTYSFRRLIQTRTGHKLTAPYFLQLAEFLKMKFLSNAFCCIILHYICFTFNLINIICLLS